MMASKSETRSPETLHLHSNRAKIPLPKLMPTPMWVLARQMEGHAIQEAKSKQVVVQSNTILRYIGRLTGLLPESPLALAKLEAIMDFMVAGLTLDTPFFHARLEHLATTGAERRSSNCHRPKPGVPKTVED